MLLKQEHSKLCICWRLFLAVDLVLLDVFSSGLISPASSFKAGPESTASQQTLKAGTFIFLKKPSDFSLNESELRQTAKNLNPCSFTPFRLFSSSSVEGIMQNLKADGSEFANKQAQV